MFPLLKRRYKLLLNRADQIVDTLSSVISKLSLVKISMAVRSLLSKQLLGYDYIELIARKYEITLLIY